MVDGAQSSLQAAEDRHQQELADSTAQSRATFEQQPQLMTSMNQDYIKQAKEQAELTQSQRAQQHHA